MARTAGVGVGTVSRVLNNSPRVAPATRARVEKAIADLGYTPNPLARSLSTGRTDSISILVPFFTSESVVQRLRGIVDVLNERGREVVLANVETLEQRDRAVAAVTGVARPSGLIVISLPLDGDSMVSLRSSGVPVMAVDVELEGCPSITVDDEAGGMLATKYLIDGGHTRIAFVGDSEDQPLGFASSRGRRKGYQRALGDAGIAVDPELVRLAPFGRMTAHQITAELLALPSPPTAIFAASDTQALGVIEAIRNAGLEVPGDISVIGFDDIEVAPYVGLTTVRQPLVESGRRAATSLMTLVEGGQVTSTMLDLEVVERDTVQRIGG